MHPPSSVLFHHEIKLLICRALWELKKQEERETLFRDTEELRELRRQKMFGRYINSSKCVYLKLDKIPLFIFMICRPGHGAPTGDIRKKKFTEHQLGRALKRSQSVFSLDEKTKGYVRREYIDDMKLDSKVIIIYKLLLLYWISSTSYVSPNSVCLLSSSVFSVCFSIQRGDIGQTSYHTFIHRHIKDM